MTEPRVKVCMESDKGARVEARFSLTDYEALILSNEAFEEGYESLQALISSSIEYIIDGSMPEPQKVPRAADIKDR